MSLPPRSFLAERGRKGVGFAVGYKYGAPMELGKYLRQWLGYGHGVNRRDAEARRFWMDGYNRCAGLSGRRVVLFLGFLGLRFASAQAVTFRAFSPGEFAGSSRFGVPSPSLARLGEAFYEIAEHGGIVGALPDEQRLHQRQAGRKLAENQAGPL